MKGLLSTTASRAWMGVAAVGLVVVVLVIALQLLPRLSAGQSVIDATRPALTGGAVGGALAGTTLISQYVDVADPLMTRRGHARGELRRLATLVKRRTGASGARARALLAREAPHTAALLRAAPLSSVAAERARLTAFLSSTLNLTSEQVQDELARSFPRIYQTLSELPGVVSGWYDVPGTETLADFDGKRVKTMPQVRDYLRDDLVAAVVEEKDRFQSLAGWGGIGYIPWLLLVLGVGLTIFGLVHARWSASHPSGRVAWGAVVAIGVLVMLVVGALQYVPRFLGAEKTIAAFEPALDEQRVIGLRAGTDLVVQAVRFGDPIMTPAGGAAAEVPKLVTFISGRAGLSERAVRRRLRRAAPRTAALLDAIPLSAVAKEQPGLAAVLSRKLHVGGGELARTLAKRTPNLDQALRAVVPATAGWNAIPGTQDLERLELGTPVRTAPEFADYLDVDVVPLLEGQRAHFDTLAGTWPPVKVVPFVVLAIGAFLVIYGIAMLFLATKPPQRA